MPPVSRFGASFICRSTSNHNEHVLGFLIISDNRVFLFGLCICEKSRVNVLTDRMWSVRSCWCTRGDAQLSATEILWWSAGSEEQEGGGEWMDEVSWPAESRRALFFSSFELFLGTGSGGQTFIPWLIYTFVRCILAYFIFDGTSKALHWHIVYLPPLSLNTRPSLTSTSFSFNLFPTCVLLFQYHGVDAAQLLHNSFNSIKLLW